MYERTVDSPPAARLLPRRRRTAAPRPRRGPCGAQPAAARPSWASPSAPSGSATTGTASPGTATGSGAAPATPVVAILSVGEPRVLGLDGGAAVVRRTTDTGDLVVMGGSCQRTWEHAVPEAAAGRPAVGRPPARGHANRWLAHRRKPEASGVGVDQEAACRKRAGTSEGIPCWTVLTTPTSPGLTLYGALLLHSRPRRGGRHPARRPGRRDHVRAADRRGPARDLPRRRPRRRRPSPSKPVRGARPGPRRARRRQPLARPWASGKAARAGEAGPAPAGTSTSPPDPICLPARVFGYGYDRPGAGHGPLAR
ncbi:hypothetical protein KAURM247S_01894 [Kitasatospora aureofaciens]